MTKNIKLELIHKYFTEIFNESDNYYIQDMALLGAELANKLKRAITYEATGLPFIPKEEQK